MPNSQSPQQTNQMDHSSAKASLGISTFLQSHLLPQKQADQNKETAQNATPSEPPTNQTTPTDTSNEINGLETRLMDEIGTLKQMIEKAQPQDANKELEDLKNELQSIIDAKE